MEGLDWVKECSLNTYRRFNRRRDQFLKLEKVRKNEMKKIERTE